MRSRSAFVAALAVAACATLGALGVQPLRWSSPSDRSSTLRFLAPSADYPLGGAALRIWARVENPNGFGLTLTRLTGSLHVADAGPIDVDFPLGLPLVARGDTVIPLDVAVRFDDLPALGRAARNAVEGRPLDYRLEGSFAVDAGSFGEPRFGPYTLLTGEIGVR